VVYCAVGCREGSQANRVRMVLAGRPRHATSGPAPDGVKKRSMCRSMALQADKPQGTRCLRSPSRGTARPCGGVEIGPPAPPTGHPGRHECAGGDTACPRPDRPGSSAARGVIARGSSGKLRAAEGPSWPLSRLDAVSQAEPGRAGMKPWQRVGPFTNRIRSGWQHLPPPPRSTHTLAPTGWAAASEP